MKKNLIALALATPLLASASNLLDNGSFERGLASWISSTSAGVLYPPTVIAYGPGVAFGEDVPADNAVSLSPDAALAHGVYFVDDNNTQALTQTFNVATAGSYDVGFSIYAPLNGFNHPVNAAFSLTINGSQVTASTVAAMPGAQTWTVLASNVFLTSSPSHTFAITYATSGSSFAKDLVIDRAYVLTAVPEPGTYAMLIVGLAVMGGMVRLRRRR